MIDRRAWRWVHVATGIALSLALAPASAAPPAALDDSKVAATVNGAPIRVGDLRSDLEVSGADDAASALERRIATVLVQQEADRMGLRDAVEVKDQLGIFERDTLRDGVFGARVSALRPDPKEVDAMLRAMSTEVRLRTAVFRAEADAKRLADRSSRGEDFDKAAAELTAGGKGQVDPGEEFIRVVEIRPEIAAAVDPLAPGKTSGVYKIENQFAVTRLVERRATAKAVPRSDAEQEALKRKQLREIGVLVDELRTRYATVDDKLLASVDFESAKGGIESFLGDKRPVARIAGEPSITVGDVADAVRKRLFHGSEAAGQGRLNRKKMDVLDDLIVKRVVMKEARRLGLDKKPEYLALRKRYEDELVFGAFIGKVINPGIKASDEEARRWYDEHRKEITSADRVRLESVAFSDRKHAEEALAKLRSGADLAWVRTNASGRLDPSSTADALQIPVGMVALPELPDGVREAVRGGKPGEYRLHAVPSGPVYVLRVAEAAPGAARPFDDVKEAVKSRVTADKRRKAFEQYVGKLREASEVKVSLSAEQLRTIGASVKSRS